jgi:pimeloyl-ACP methyl ester carboxylesterase
MRRIVGGPAGARELGWSDSGSGPAVVLLHPFPFDRRLWAGLAEALAARRRVIAIDARGFGESAPGLGGRFSVDDLADDVAALLDELDVRRATLLGMSMGGYAALAFAARHGTRLERLVLADTRAASDTVEARMRREEAIAMLRAPGPAGGVSPYLASSLPRLLSPAAPPALYTFVRARAEDRTDRLIAGVEALRDRPDRTSALPGIACPTLVIAGAGDQVTPVADMRAMASAIPDARFIVVAGTGHLAHLEAPGAFETEVSSFLEGAT